MTKPMMVTLDTETTIRNKVGKNKGTAFCTDNFIVSLGYKSKGIDNVIIKQNPRFSPIANHIRGGFADRGWFTDKNTIIVGQNIKFDLHHIQKENLFTGDWNFRIWDTQLAEYLLTGQDTKYASLDKLSEKYGGTIKDDRIKVMWDAGVDTDQIPEDMLTEYLEHDVKNTEMVCLAQMKLAKKSGQLPLMRTQMDALLATVMMEYNGLYVNPDTLDEVAERTRKEMDAAHYTAQDIFSKSGIPRDLQNIDSKDQLSAILFGGTFSHAVKTLVGKYKNGNDKYSKVDKVIKVRGLCEHAAKDEWLTKKKGVYKTNDTVLNELVSTLTDPIAVDFIENLQKYRYYSKQYGTYCEGIKKLIFEDGYIHHNLNHCASNTGRLTSNNPNLQNITNKGDTHIKKVFTSRFKNEGVIVEVDYKQLEVICLAHLTQDPQLKKDIINGVDVHAATGKKVYGEKHKMDKEERRIVKGVNFGLIYGGGVNTLAQQTGADKKLVKKIIASFFERYPKVKEWQTSMYERVKSNRQSSGNKTKSGYPSGISKLTSDTGRIYTFHEFDNTYISKWGNNEKVTFSPTHVKNYPVQGFATGDIVPMIMGKLYRMLINTPVYSDSVKMINQVHDSILFDIKKDVLDIAILSIKDIMEAAPQYLKESFDIDFTLPLKVSVSVGDNWHDQKDI